eukprot:scaffold274550_cov31-Tisochrysis_lutea.AAC.1
MCDLASFWPMGLLASVSPSPPPGSLVWPVRCDGPLLCWCWLRVCWVSWGGVACVVREPVARLPIRPAVSPESTSL